jgi:malonyl-CoA O-methyltransferase
MNSGLDARHVRHAFARAAAGYERHAVLQAEVGRRLRERLDGLPLQPDVVLDVGCGSGAGSAALRARHPQARLIALDVTVAMLRTLGDAHPGAATPVCGDAQALPLADASVDLVHSSLCLQWCDDPGLALAEFARVLRPGGVLLLSTFGPGTLAELRAAFAAVDDAPHVGRFVDMHDLGDVLLANGFADPVLERDDFTLIYDDARTLMRELRAIGATNADAGRRRTLTGKARLARVVDAYERFRRDGVLPATYEVVYAQALAPAPGQPLRSADGGEIASFPIERLRGSRARPRSGARS